ncbi:MAG: YggT family protein [Betaproteobacteria bacterium]|nr:YggT family protein [Betaproteobacteria bacterium]
MIVLPNLMRAIAVVFYTVLNVYFWIVIISAVLSWVRPDPYNPIVRILRALTEPVYYRIRKHLPFTYMAGIDFSPVVVLLIIKLIEIAVVDSLYQYALRLA